VDETPIDPHSVAAGQGWSYHFAELGIDFDVKVGEERHGRRMAVFELTTRPGEEPPVHTHATEDEFFYVLDGEVAFRCGEDRFEVAGGGCVLLPRGLPHGYRIGSPAARLLVVTTPAPEDGVRGWSGFVGSFERNSELRSSPG
jgi:quercetin dioxygenase-like cupin family protein